MIIEEYQEEDLEKMKEFYAQILFESHHFVPYAPTLNKGKFNSPQLYKYNIKEGDNIIAHLGVRIINPDKFSIGLAILNDYCGQGIGSQLLKYALTIVKQKGGNQVIATIHKDNWKSLVLFIKHGFHVIKDDDVLTVFKKI